MLFWFVYKLTVDSYSQPVKNKKKKQTNLPTGFSGICILMLYKESINYQVEYCTNL